MNKISIIFSMLVASLLMSALPAFSGSTGPYGTYGPSISYDMNSGVDTHQAAFSGATGPYGAFGPTFKGVETQQTAFAGGTGPYGSFGTFGMYQGSESSQFANKDECLLVAKNCPPEMASVQHRIDRLNTEIARGTDVYTPAELNVLNDKLNAAYEELNNANMDKGY